MQAAFKHACQVILMHTKIGKSLACHFIKSLESLCEISYYPHFIGEKFKAER